MKESSDYFTENFSTKYLFRNNNNGFAVGYLRFLKWGGSLEV